MIEKAIGPKHKICILALFIMGNYLLTAPQGAAGKDSALAFLAGLVFCVPLYMVYIRIHSLIGDKTLAQALPLLLGKAAGSLLLVVFALYSLIVAILTVRSLTQFIKITALPQTPSFLPAILLALLSVWLVKNRFSVLAKFSTAYFFVAAACVVFLFAMSVPNMRLHNMMPVLYGNAQDMGAQALRDVGLSLGQAALLLFVFRNDHKKEGRRVYFLGLALGGLLLLLCILNSLLIFGEPFLQKLSYPYYSAVSVVSAGQIFTRMESMTYGVYVICSLVKLSVCMLTCLHILRQFFPRFTDKWIYILGFGVALCGILPISHSGKVVQAFLWISLGLEILIPLIIWFVAEAKGERERRHLEPPAEPLEPAP